jgi:hypothetical protein
MGSLFEPDYVKFLFKMQIKSMLSLAFLCGKTETKVIAISHYPVVQ